MRIEDMLPPEEHRPALLYTLPDIQFPAELNLAHWMVDRHVDDGLGDRVAIHFYPADDGPRQEVTYAELQSRVRAIAAGLRRLGVERGDRVLVGTREHPDTAAAVVACFAIGALAVPFSTLTRTREIGFIIEDNEPAVAIVDVKLLDQVEPLLPETTCTWVVWGGERAGLVPFDEVAADSSDFTMVATSRDDWAVVFYTAGTTGRSKPTAHTHRGLLASALLQNTYNFDYEDGSEPRPVVTVMGPIGHAFGWLGKVLHPLVAGGAGVLMEAIGPAPLHHALKECGLTDLEGGASVFKRFLLDDPHDIDLKTTGLQRLFSLMHDETTDRRLEEAFGLTPRNMFGMAPLGALVSWVKPGTPLGSCGVPMPGYEMAIVPVDLDETFLPGGLINELPPGEVGRLALRGPTGITYLNRPELAAQEVVRGWTILDDLFVRDADGCLWFRGRVSGIIKTSGYSVAPIEVEEILDTHPAVWRAAVIGIPDSDRGEAIKAIVQLNEGHEASDELAAELQKLVRDMTAPYKYPRVVEFIDELPMDATGKIPYGLLRKREEELRAAADR